MTEPLRTRYVPGYDLFKLIVAVILTVILFLLMLLDKQGGGGQIDPTFAPTAANTATMQPTPLFTATPSPEAKATDISSTPTPTSTVASTATQTAEPPPTESPTPVPPTVTPTPEPSPTPDPNACPSNPAQIKVGDKVKVLDWLNFRVGPGLNYPIQHTNRPGTVMEVIGGPVCTVKDENPPRAYLWWNVRMGNGKEGWSAEAPLNFPNYFMEPVK